MTDRSDELRDRLPDTDRIRDRIREQREVGDDDLADSNDPDGYYKYELKNLKGADDVAGSSDPEGLRYELRNLKGADDLADANDPDGYYKYELENLKGVAPESKLDDGGLTGADTAAVFAKYDGIDGESAAAEPNAYLEIDEIPGESQRLVDGPARTGWKVEEGEAGWKVEEGEAGWKVEEGEAGWKVEEGEAGWKVEEGESAWSGVDDITAVAESVVDHETGGVGAEPDAPALKWNDVTLKESAPESVVTDQKSDDIASKVVDHRADDLTPGIEDAVDTEMEATTAPPPDNLEIEQTASYTETADPVGDALAPLDGGGDEFTALPEFDASFDAVPPTADTDDLGDGF